jgi:RES domain-containing protein
MESGGERLFDPRLLDFLENEEATQWEGRVWRQVFGDTNPLTPNVRGSRWNPPDEEALYCSLAAEGAAAEIDYLNIQQPFPIAKEREMYALDVRLSRIVDLRGAHKLDELDLSIEVADTPSGAARCQEVGAAVAWLGYGGLMVPSLRYATIWSSM